MGGFMATHHLEIKVGNDTYRLYTKRIDRKKCLYMQHVNAHFNQSNTSNKLLVIKEQVAFAEKLNSGQPTNNVHECLIMDLVFNIEGYNARTPNLADIISYPDKKFNALGVNEDIFPVQVYNAIDPELGRVPLNFTEEDNSNGYLEVSANAGQVCEGEILIPPQIQPPPVINMHVVSCILRIHTSVALP